MTTFFMLGVEGKLKSNKILEIDKLINWSRCLNHLRKIHKQDESLMGGQVPYDRLKMFKSILLQNWYSLSDEQLVEALSVRIDFMAFTGFELADTIPDSSTFGRFRNKLIDRNLDERLFREINNQLEKLGLKLEKAQCAIIDATIVESANRPKRTITVENDREESELIITQEESKDPDAKWLKKGKKYYFGYKNFANVDEEGYYDNLHTEPANSAEVNKLEKIIEKSKAKSVLADKAYSSKANRTMLKEKGKVDGIMYKAQKNKPISPLQKYLNKQISKCRFVVERSFGTLKRQFKFTKASYATTRKVQAQFTFKAICANLLKAVNKVLNGDVIINYTNPREKYA